MRLSKIEATFSNEDVQLAFHAGCQKLKEKKPEIFSVVDVSSLDVTGAYLYLKGSVKNDGSWYGFTAKLDLIPSKDNAGIGVKLVDFSMDGWAVRFLLGCKALFGDKTEVFVMKKIRDAAGSALDIDVDACVIWINLKEKLATVGSEIGAVSGVYVGGSSIIIQVG